MSYIIMFTAKKWLYCLF